MAIIPMSTLERNVEIRIPTQCGDCKKALPESLRDSLLTDAKRDFSKWFGGFEVEHKHGGYTFPDGTLAEEEVDVVESNCTSEALEEHFEDVKSFAVRVANELSQDCVALSIDRKMQFYGRSSGVGKCLHSKKGTIPTFPISAPVGRAPKTDLEKMQALYAALDYSKFNISTAKLIFNELLNYDPTNESLPWRDWPKDLKDRLKDAPQVIAYARGFKIAYLHQAAGQLSRGTTRAVISRILRDNANSFYGLFIVSNDAGNEWALVNARLVDGKASRLILRNIPVGTGKGARTATDRLILVDLDGREKLTAQQIQELHDNAFDVEGVSNEFYKKIAAWYFWAQDHRGVVYPRSVASEADKSIFFIRLLTRLIFCWFMRQKGLIPEKIFQSNFIKEQLKDAGHKAGTYHKAILQNLFFATLNREINERSFRRKYEEGRDGNYGVTTLYRYADLMKNPDEMLDIFKKVPFVNGGLFECLDNTSKKPEIRLDDFSENTKNNICIPNELFFGQARDVDLSKAFGDKKHKKDSAAGLIHILNQYQFTVEENTPLDQSVALDPELLGKVFENLLASYNEETKTTARKALGAFYTPREIVEYMVDESLLAYLKVKLADSSDAMDEKLRKLIGYNDEPHDFSDDEVDILVNAIDHLKALDPAVGSGAFPMGMLHKLVHILGKLDPGNEKWKQKQLAKIEDVELREQAERAFRENPADYGRKLYLIQNCIYGVDIQPVAVQIAKMRFFISLIVDQKSTTDAANNYGILALPNLETNFVAANTLIGIDKPQQQVLRNPDIDKKEKELHRVRQKHFNAKDPKTKAKYREKDENLRAEIAELLKHEGWGDKTAQKLANWNPYNQNASSEFFDPEWMFGINNDFNIIMGNPPYLESRHPSFTEDLKDLYQNSAEKRWGIDAKLITRGADLLVYFFEVSIKFIDAAGCITLITQNAWLNTEYGINLQNFLMKHTDVTHIIDSQYRYFPAGEGPNINTVITLFRGDKPSLTNRFGFYTLKDNIQNVFLNMNLKASMATENFKVNYFSSSDTLLKKYKWGILQNLDDFLLYLLNTIESKGKTIDAIPSKTTFTFGQGLNLSKSHFVPIEIVSKYNIDVKNCFPILYSGSPYEIKKANWYLIRKIRTNKTTEKKLQADGYDVFDEHATRKKPPILIMPRGISKHYCSLNSIQAYSLSGVDVYADDLEDIENEVMRLWCFLNSSVFWLLREISGRKNLGGGLLKSEAADLKSFPVYFPLQIKKNDFKSLLDRDSLETIDEIKSVDHQKIDKIIFDYLGFDEENCKTCTEHLRDAISFRCGRSVT